MNLSRVYQVLRSYMTASRKVRSSRRAVLDDLRVLLSPVYDEGVSTSQRSNEVRLMVARLFLLGKARGRPSRIEEETKDAA